MSSFYLDADKSFIDYRETQWLPGKRFRGSPATVNTDEPFGIFLGAGQTFGRFVERPFVDLVSERLGIPCINLGLGGAGAKNYMHRDTLALINKAQFCVVQVMSGRSSRNDLFDAQSGQSVYGLDPGQLGPSAFAERIVRHAIEIGDTRYLLNEIRRGWIQETWELARRIYCPKLLLYVSKRPPAYEASPGSVHELAGEFPQFIDQATLDAVRPHFDGLAVCVSRRGSPHAVMKDGQRVRIDMGGRLTDMNNYYPSPEMHEDAANVLVPSIAAMSRGWKEALPADEAVKPNFMIVGAAKCGTSALADQMRRHPDIYIPPVKEAHHFDRRGDWGAYLAHFAGGRGKAMRGEATVSYTMAPVVRNVPELMRERLGDIPIIYIVRDPLDRIVSQFRHALREQRVAGELFDWLQTKDAMDKAVVRTDYGYQLSLYEKCFSRIHVEFYEEYRDNHSAALARIFDFLGLDPSFAVRIFNEEVNSAADRYPVQSDERSRELVDSMLGKQLRAFLQRFGREGLWPSIAEKNVLLS